MAANQPALLRLHFEAPCWRQEEEEGNARDGKTTSKNGWAYHLPSCKSLPKIDCNGKLL